MRSPLRLGAAAMAVILASSCSHDQNGGTSPLSAANESAALQKGPKKGVAETRQAAREEGLAWATVMPGGLSVSKSIGPEGGSLTIPQAGVTVTVPAGALTSTTTIRMRIHGGKVVAYDFAPHGLTFLKPLTLTQNLAYTTTTASTASLLNLGYYADSASVDDAGATISESNAGSLNATAWSFAAPIWHFSGYMVATGRSGIVSGG